MANQNGIASREEDQPSPCLLEDSEFFLLGAMRICATNLFSMWEIGITPHISSLAGQRIVDLSLMDLRLMLLTARRYARPVVWRILDNAAHQQHQPGKSKLGFDFMLSGRNKAGSLY
jgi:hypothetical protein